MAETTVATRTPVPAPKTTADVLIEIRQELARQNELCTQTLQLLLQLVRERRGDQGGEEGDTNG